VFCGNSLSWKKREDLDAQILPKHFEQDQGDKTGEKNQGSCKTDAPEKAYHGAFFLFEVRGSYLYPSMVKVPSFVKSKTKFAVGLASRR
jgi:hypothetical protein